MPGLVLYKKICRLPVSDFLPKQASWLPCHMRVHDKILLVLKGTPAGNKLTNCIIFSQLLPIQKIAMYFFKNYLIKL
jgi:hypothetical protein